MLRCGLLIALGLLLPLVPVAAQDAPVPLAEAAGRISVPDGFRVTLFAGEPDVVQPIAFTFDDRGRLWVIECLSYPDWETQGRAGHDRIVILEDTDGDGRHDSRKVFWDQGTNLTGIELGFGGVFLCSTPHLLFLPDRDGDDRPDGPPQVLLDGWDLKARHNVFNGLTWGPDGWLYGCNGILSNSKIGKPGTPEDQRVTMNCGVWRYHPTRHVFEVVAHGTTNPWGLDFDRRGAMFITNCVIKHLFHVVPGGHYERMFGQDVTPYVYNLMESCADHIHWGGGHWTSSRGGQGEHDKAGGGHAHAGAMIYLADNWPAEYRGRLFTCNIHGTRVNQDLLEQEGSGYVARHGEDFLFANDPWFRGLELKYGPDGGVYLTDWSDTGECHDYEDIHRENGRIFKVTFGQPQPARIDLTALSDLELIGLHSHPSEWYVRRARRLLQERAAAGTLAPETHAALAQLFERQRDVPQQLRLLWTIHALGGLTAEESQELLQSDRAEPTVRAWAVRLELDDREAPAPIRKVLAELARLDPSPEVRLALASGLQRLPLEQRGPIAEGLVAHGEDANDPNLPLMYWYGIEPLVAADRARAVELILKAEIPLLRRFIARRMAETITDPASLAPLVALLERGEPEIRRDVLRGMFDIARGLRDVPMPAGWSETAAALDRSDDAEIRDLATSLSLVFGDTAAMDRLRTLLVNKQAPATERQKALEGLVQARDAGLPVILYRLIESKELGGPALRGLAAYAAAETPEMILKHYGSFTAAEKQDAISTLASRPEYAHALLDAVQRGTIPRTDISTFTARQLAGFGDERLTKKLEAVWGAVRQTSQQRARIIADYKQMLTSENLKNADPAAGRAVFAKTCANCHQLFDAGRGVGPNLTGSQRTNVDYVLENLIDPNALIGRDYRVTTLVTADGRVLNGIVTAENASTLTLRTATEDVILPQTEIEERKESNVSMMPEGMLDKLSDADVLNLVRYLASPEQVPLPK